MITVNAYPDALDGKAPAVKTNAVLQNYKSQQAIVLKTDSIPRTKDRPAEHVIAAPVRTQKGEARPRAN